MANRTNDTDSFITIFHRAKTRRNEWKKQMEDKLNEMSKQIEASRQSHYLDLGEV